MNIVAIESSSNICSVSSFKDNKLENVIDTFSEKSNSDSIPFLLQAIIKDFDNIKEIDCFAVSVGPGSFTGLRSAISIVKGMVFASKIKIAPVPTFQSMNLKINHRGVHFLILSSFKNKCFVQEFKSLKKVGDPFIETIENLKTIESPIYGYSCNKIKQSNYKEFKLSSIMIGEYAIANYKEIAKDYNSSINPIYLSSNKYVQINDRKS
ncbi:MAG: tRNA (adenosine(37)-N6)-threonylcarbamoyltransferase complex dimerization subunit type 1 TsaB [Candidatus Marinimicrobia bacterium]|nr:tRNA (adenosine(37)-N6)-threonylcarbamoyltransferase complex dimerization subunit type 1 TsaB [Candidatus Neomarinimicrobiota bacterium]|tara:strand:+ start:5139 stop:5765 length:627 start_codon:yes stop_codon:yes gene_type:complete